MAKKTTVHDKLVSALVERGSQIVEGARTRKYTVLTRPDGRPGYIYVGRAGAIRLGKSVSGSIAAAPAMRVTLLEDDG